MSKYEAAFSLSRLSAAAAVIPRGHCWARPVGWPAAVAILALLAPVASAAPLAAKLQPLLRQGDPIAGARVSSDSTFLVGALNDHGQVFLAAESAAGGPLLIQASGGQLAPLVAAGAPAPGGQWSGQTAFQLPLSMNQQGSAVFTAAVRTGHRSQIGVFRWDGPTHQMSPMELSVPATLPSLSFAVIGGSPMVLNDGGDVAFAAPVDDPSGQQAAQNGVFFRRREGQLRPVAIPGQVLPDGSTVAWAVSPSLTNGGRVAFLTRAVDDDRSLPYLWENGVVTPLPFDSVVAPPGTLFYGFTGIWANNHDANILLAAHLHSLAGHFYGLYLQTGAAATPVAVLGQTMPDGGRFLTLQNNGVSAANALGEYAFLATMEDGTTAAYRLNADGTAALLLKSGTVTNLGTVTDVGEGAGLSQGIALNAQGQVALTVRLNDRADAVVLLSAGPGKG